MISSAYWSRVCVCLCGSVCTGLSGGLTLLVIMQSPKVRVSSLVVTETGSIVQQGGLFVHKNGFTGNIPHCFKSRAVVAKVEGMLGN